MDIIRPIPLYVITPLCLLWFGFNMAAQVVVVSFGVFVILTVHTYDSVGHIPDMNVRPALAAVPTRLQRAEVMSAILPHLIAGLRLALVTAWSLSVVTELTGADLHVSYLPPGLVRLMFESAFRLNAPAVLVIVLLYGVMAFVSDYPLRAVAKRYSPSYLPLGLVGEIPDSR